MVDIEAEFRKAFGPTTACNEPASDRPLTVDDLRKMMKDLPPPPPEVRVSKYVPAMGPAKPSAMPITDDMRQMVDDLGQQVGPIAWKLSTGSGDVFFINPVNMKNP